MISLTPKEHKDYQSLVKARDEIMNVTNFVDVSSTVKENRVKMMEIFNSLVGPLAEEFALIQPHRKFLLEGPAIHKEEDTFLFLFSDLLLCTSRLDSVFLLLQIIPINQNFRVQKIQKKTEMTFH